LFIVGKMMSKILVLHGPNLNLLGRREPDIYGNTTLVDINTQLTQSTSYELTFLQSNAEHILIDRIHKTLDDGTALILFNPAAFTHTSIALRDALLATQTPFIEIHLSDTQAREDFRKHSYFSDIALAVFAGHGVQSYLQALAQAEKHLNNPST
jgi:3-dehydroquinate dehydratase II